MPASSRAPAAHAPTFVEWLVGAAGLETCVSLGQPDPGTSSLFARALGLTPAERLADAARAARFVLRGRGRLRGEAVTELLFDPAAMLAVPQASTVCASLAVRYRHLEAGQPVFAP